MRVNSVAHIEAQVAKIEAVIKRSNHDEMKRVLTNWVAALRKKLESQKVPQVLPSASRVPGERQDGSESVSGDRPDSSASLGTGSDSGG